MNPQQKNSNFFCQPGPMEAVDPIIWTRHEKLRRNSIRFTLVILYLYLSYTIYNRINIEYI